MADFGIAKAVEGLGTGFRTATGRTVGTPSYMAPEQAMDREVGAWTDLYSTGVMAYEMLGGKTPFADTPSPMAVLMKHVTEPPPPLAGLRPDLDPRLIAWVERLLAKDPAARPANAREVFDVLDEILTATLGPRWQREARLAEGFQGARSLGNPAATPATPRLPTAVGGVAVLVGVVAVALLAGGGDNDNGPPASFGTGLKQALAPLQRANGALSEELFSLGLDQDSPAPSQERARQAGAATDGAARTIGDLEPATTKETRLREQANAAPASEKSYLALVDKALARRASDAEIEDLAVRARALTDRLQPLATTVTGIALSVSGTESLQFWAYGGEAGRVQESQRNYEIEIGRTVRRIGRLTNLKRLTVSEALSSFGLISTGADLGGGCP